MPWNPPELQLQWGSYFKADIEEQNKVVTTAQLALTAGLITKRSAVKAIATIEAYGIEDVDEYLEALEKEAEAAHEDEIVKTGDKMDLANEKAEDAPEKSPKPPPKVPE